MLSVRVRPSSVGCALVLSRASPLYLTSPAAALPPCSSNTNTNTNSSSNSNSSVRTLHTHAARAFKSKKKQQAEKVEAEKLAAAAESKEQPSAASSPSAPAGDTSVSSSSAADAPSSSFSSSSSSSSSPSCGSLASDLSSSVAPIVSRFPASPDLELSSPSFDDVTDADAERVSSEREDTAQEEEEEEYQARVAQAAAFPRTTTISAASLASYFSLLPTAIRPVEAEKVVLVPAIEDDIHVDHAPLRTRLKSDLSFSLQPNDPLNRDSNLPFTLAYYKQMLNTPLASQVEQRRVTQKEQRDNMDKQIRQHAQQQANKPRMEDQRGTQTSSSLSSPSSSSSSFSSELHFLSSVLSSPSSFGGLSRGGSGPGVALSAIHRWAKEGRNELVVEAWKGVIKQTMEQVNHTLQALLKQGRATDSAAAASSTPSVASSNTAPAVTPASASEVLSFLHSLQRPPLLDSACGLVVSCALRIPTPSSRALAKEVFSSIEKLQKLQQEVYERYMWELSMQQMMWKGNKGSTQASLFNPSSHSNSSSSSSSDVPYGMEDSSSSSSSSTESDLSRPFNPFSSKPYVKFIDTLMRPNQVVSKELRLQLTPSGNAKSHSATTLSSSIADAPLSRRARRKAALAARSASISSPSGAASVPLVKPALQLFNRLLDQPSSASVCVSNDPSSSAASFDTSFRFSWPLVSRSMLSGIIDVVNIEVEALRNKHNNVLETAQRAQEARYQIKKGHQHSHALPTTSENNHNNNKSVDYYCCAFDQLSESEILNTLNEITAKKKESLELFKGISMHVLQSFIRHNASSGGANAMSSGVEASEGTRRKEAAAAAAAAKSKRASSPAAAVEPVESELSSSADSVRHSSSSLSASYTQDNLHWRQWKIMKLLLCNTVSARSNSLVEDASTAALGGGGGAGAGSDDASPQASLARPELAGQWRLRAMHALSASGIIDLREAAAKELMDLYPSIITRSLLAQPKFKLTPQLDALVFQPLRALSDTHINLVHSILEHLIQLCHRFSHLELQAEKWDPLESTCRHASLSIL